MRVYISGALQASRDLGAARARYELAAAAATRAGHIPYLPHLHTDPERAAGLSAEVVFARDRDELYRADTVIAFVDEPSLGVGAELVLAGESGTAILVLHHSGVTVSRFLLGYLESIGASVRSYTTSEDIAPAIADFLAVLLRRSVV